MQSRWVHAFTGLVEKSQWPDLKSRGMIHERRIGLCQIKQGAFSVILETARDALAEMAELAESDHTELVAKDLSGKVIDAAALQSEVDQCRGSV